MWTRLALLCLKGKVGEKPPLERGSSPFHLNFFL